MRPFIQQLRSVQAIFGGGADPGSVGGGFAGYAVPLSNESYFKSLSGGTTAASNTDTLWNGDGAGTHLAANLDDHGNAAYFTMFWVTTNVDFVSGDTGHYGHACIREGTNASTTNAAGTDGTPYAPTTYATPGTGSWIDYYTGGTVANAPSGGRDAEWGMNYVLDDASRLYANGATFFVIPTTQSGFSGSGLGERDNTWDQAGFAAILCDNQTGGDEDQTASNTLTVGHTGYHLIIDRTRMRNTTTGAGQPKSYVRFHKEIDGEDYLNVRTNTAGTTVTSRGFQFGGTRDSIGTYRYEYLSFAVKNFTAGNHTVTQYGNRHESADNTEQVAASNISVINTDMFRKFQFKTLETAHAVTGTSFVDSAFAPITMTVDGTAKVMIILSTSVHLYNVLSPYFRITRNGTDVTPNGTDPGSNKYPSINCHNRQYTTGAVASPDNVTLPYSVLWIDEPPAGTHTYQVQVAGQAAGPKWNTNDAGGDGFKGYFIVAELAFATSGF